MEPHDIAFFMPDVSNTGIFLGPAFHSSGHPGCLVVFGPAYHNTVCHYMMRNTHALCKLFTTSKTWTETAGGWLTMRMVGIPNQLLWCWDRIYRYWILTLNSGQFIAKISYHFRDFYNRLLGSSLYRHSGYCTANKRQFISNQTTALEYNDLYIENANLAT